MTKITYLGDGETKAFVFDFPFFTLSDILVKQNDNIIKSGYQISPVSNPEPADIPYCGGTITFDVAPSETDTITIIRRIVLDRLIDYQPTITIDTQTLNQDLSFMIEVLKDFNTDLDDFYSAYSYIVNLGDINEFIEKQEEFIEKQNVLIEKLAEVQNEISALGGVENIAKQSDITALKNATSFTNTGKQNIVSWSMLSGDMISVNFLGRNAGQYKYTPERSGLLSLVFVSSVSSDVSIQNSNTVTMYTQRATVGERETIFIPVVQGKSITVAVPALSEVNYQRLFLYAGV